MVDHRPVAAHAEREQQLRHHHGTVQLGQRISFQA
jgi:hypothetical protein